MTQSTAGQASHVVEAADARTRRGTKRKQLHHPSASHQPDLPATASAALQHQAAEDAAAAEQRRKERKERKRARREARQGEGTIGEPTTAAVGSAPPTVVEAATAGTASGLAEPVQPACLTHATQPSASTDSIHKAAAEVVNPPLRPESARPGADGTAAGASASLPETTAMAQKKKKMKLAPTQTGAAGSSGCAVEPARKLQMAAPAAEQTGPQQRFKASAPEFNMAHLRRPSAVAAAITAGDEAAKQAAKEAQDVAHSCWLPMALQDDEEKVALCEEWLAEAVPGSCKLKTTAAFVIYQAFKLEMLVRSAIKHCEDPQPLLEQTSKLQTRVICLARKAQSMLPPDWVPVVSKTAWIAQLGGPVNTPMYDLFLSKLKRVKDIMQLKHPDRMLTCCATQACAYLLSAAATVLHPAAAAPAPSYASDLSPLVATADAAGPALATADAAGPALATADAAGPALATADAAGPALATADAAGHALATAAAAVDTSAACVDVAAPATVDAALTNKPDDVLPICQPAEVRSNTVLAAEQLTSCEEPQPRLCTPDQPEVQPTAVASTKSGRRHGSRHKPDQTCLQAVTARQGEAGAVSTRSQGPSTAVEARERGEVPSTRAGPQPHTGAATAALPASAAAQPAACVAAPGGSAVAGQAGAQHAAGLAERPGHDKKTALASAQVRAQQPAQLPAGKPDSRGKPPLAPKPAQTQVARQQVQDPERGEDGVLPVARQATGHKPNIEPDHGPGQASALNPAQQPAPTAAQQLPATQGSSGQRAQWVVRKAAKKVVQRPPATQGPAQEAAKKAAEQPAATQSLPQQQPQKAAQRAAQQPAAAQSQSQQVAQRAAEHAAATQGPPQQQPQETAKEAAERPAATQSQKAVKTAPEQPLAAQSPAQRTAQRAAEPPAARQAPSQQQAQKAAKKAAQQPPATQDASQEAAEQPAATQAVPQQQAPKAAKKAAQQPPATQDASQEAAEQSAATQAPSQQQAQKAVEKAAHQLSLTQQPAEASAERPASQPDQQPLQQLAQQSAQGSAPVIAQQERLDCQGLRLLPGDKALSCEDPVHRQTGPDTAAAQLNAYLKLDDAGLADTAQFLQGVPAPPYSTVRATVRGKPKSSAIVGQEQQDRYDRFDTHIRKLLWWRAYELHGRDSADAALKARDRFVQVCLMGQRPAPSSSPQYYWPPAQEACIIYVNMLRKVYGDDLVLAPHVMSVDALNAQGTAGAEDLSNLRLLHKRFVVYRATKAAPVPNPAPGQCVAGQAPDNAQPMAASGSSGSADVDIVGLDQQDDADSADSGHVPPDWNQALKQLWMTAKQKLGPLTLSQVRDVLDAEAPSCDLQTGTWQAGHYSTKRVPGTFTVHEAIHSNLVQSLKRFCRLYFIDGSVPGSLPCGYHSQAELPGLWCEVDQTANRMFPAALRSNRPGSFFKQMSVESSGAASFTLFAPCGQTTMTTAFHQETKKRRSFNCGTGDFIVQPLCTADTIRRVERVHAGVMGAHERQACLLPLEMYLEEGIPLVCYSRDQGRAEMVELPEQSCHAFLTFPNFEHYSPRVKVSSNDWHVESEMSSAYLLEKLMASARQAGVEAEVPEGHPDPDIWVETHYAMLEPSSLHETTSEPVGEVGADGTWQRPWAEEMQGQEYREGGMGEQGEAASRSSDVEVLVVRCVERELDNLQGKLKATAWNALLTATQSLRVLQDALPVLVDLGMRAQQSVSDTPSHFSEEYLQRLVHLVQKALDSAGLNGAAHRAEAFLADRWPGTPPAGGKRLREGSNQAGHKQSSKTASCVTDSRVQEMVRTDEVFTIFMHLVEAADWKGTCAASEERRQKAAAKLKQFNAAVGALAESDLLSLSPPALRAHWMMALQREWQSCQLVDSNLGLEQLGKAREHRCWLEQLHELKAQQLLQSHVHDWGLK